MLLSRKQTLWKSTNLLSATDLLKFKLNLKLISVGEQFNRTIKRFPNFHMELMIFHMLLFYCRNIDLLLEPLANWKFEWVLTYKTINNQEPDLSDSYKLVWQKTFRLRNFQNKCSWIVDFTDFSFHAQFSCKF